MQLTERQIQLIVTICENINILNKNTLKHMDPEKDAVDLKQYINAIQEREELIKLLQENSMQTVRSVNVTIEVDILVQHPIYQPEPLTIDEAREVFLESIKGQLDMLGGGLVTKVEDNVYEYDPSEELWGLSKPLSTTPIDINGWNDF